MPSNAHSSGASASFSAAEIDALDHVLRTLLRGGVVGPEIVRSVTFNGIARKVQMMRATHERRKASARSRLDASDAEAEQG